MGGKKFLPTVFVEKGRFRDDALAQTPGRRLLGRRRCKNAGSSRQGIAAGGWTVCDARGACRVSHRGRDGHAPCATLETPPGLRGIARALPYLKLLRRRVGGCWESETNVCSGQVLGDLHRAAALRVTHDCTSCTAVSVTNGWQTEQHQPN
jgi:hypothetical protein